jgi:hypothetical protein
MEWVEFWNEWQLRFVNYFNFIIQVSSINTKNDDCRRHSSVGICIIIGYG